MIRKIAAVAAAAAAAGALGLGAQAALAAPAAPAGPHAAGVTRTAKPSASQDRALIARQVRNLLKYNPGASQISSDAVRYKGAILGVSLPRQSGSAGPDSESGVCPNNYVCLFQNINFNGSPFVGDWIAFNKCNVNYNLYNYVMSNGGSTWADQASSIDYPGSPSYNEAKFNHDGNWWLYLYRDHYLRNLVQDGGPNPHGNSNDWITGLYAC
jgi:hypothetical protein